MVDIFYFYFPVLEDSRVGFNLFPQHFYPERVRNVRLNCPSSILDNLDKASKVWNVNKFRVKGVKVY